MIGSKPSWLSAGNWPSIPTVFPTSFGRLAARLRPEQIVALTAFGGLMVATNLFNNALRVDLDEYLEPYRKKEQQG